MQNKQNIFEKEQMVGAVDNILRNLSDRVKYTIVVYEKQIKELKKNKEIRFIMAWNEICSKAKENYREIERILENINKRKYKYIFLYTQENFEINEIKGMKVIDLATYIFFEDNETLIAVVTEH